MELNVRSSYCLPQVGRTGKCLGETEAWAQVPQDPLSITSLLSASFSSTQVQRVWSPGHLQQLWALNNKNEPLFYQLQWGQSLGRIPLEPAMQSSERAVLDYERGGVLGKTPNHPDALGPTRCPQQNRGLGAIVPSLWKCLHSKTNHTLLAFSETCRKQFRPFGPPMRAICAWEERKCPCRCW